MIGSQRLPIASTHLEILKLTSSLLLPPKQKEQPDYCYTLSLDLTRSARTFHGLCHSSWPQEKKKQKTKTLIFSVAIIHDINVWKQVCGERLKSHRL